MASKSSHVDLVGTLFIIWGVLTTLIGLSTLSLGIGAVAIITSASHGGGGGQVAAGLTAAAFTTQPYIAFNDIPKVENLKKIFTENYIEKPTLVSSAKATN